MIDAAKFIVENSIELAGDYYNRIVKKNIDSFNDVELEEIKKIYNNSISARTVLKNFRKTGDVYNYLLTITTNKNDDIKKLFLRYKLVPFESLIDEFEVRFKNELEERFSFSDLILGNVYTTWDTVFLADTYRTQTFGILTARNKDNVITGIVVRGAFGLSEGYDNYWINEDECIYHLISGNNINNDNLLTGKYPIYVFDKISENQQLFRGVFYLEEHLESKHSVKLVRNRENSLNRRVTKRKNYQLPTTKPFVKMIDKKDSVTAGTDQIGNNKIIAGAKAESDVVKTLTSLGFIVEDVANNSNYHFDILIKELELGLEVKNIRNGNFYISENEIRVFEREQSRICFVDKKEILISKKYKDVIALKRIFNDLRSIDSEIKDLYHGVYEPDSLRIGINESNKKELLEDFYLITNYTYEQVNKILK